MTPAPQALTREFLMAAQYRRCGWYVLLGVLAALCVAATLRVHGPLAGAGPNWGGFLAGGSLLILASLGLLVAVHRWRLRIDENGIARRRFSKWDLWPWEEFRNGQVQGSRNGFTSALRPAWRNSIALSLLEENDQAFVLGVCKAFYRPPEEAVALPEGELRLRYRVFSKAMFREDGVSSANGSGEFSVPWSEVKQVRLVHLEHWSGQLCGIELDLPNRTLDIVAISEISGPGIQIRGVLNCQATRVIEAFLTRYVAPEKLSRHALYGPPQSISECDRRISKAERDLRKATWMHRLLPAACLAATSGCFVPKLFAAWQAPAAFPNRGWMVLLSVLIIATIFSCPVAYWAMLREIRRRYSTSLRELETWKSERALQDTIVSA